MRLFVALDLPDEVRHAVGTLMAQLQPKCREARWVRPESMHLTLKFIGHAVADNDDDKLSAVRAALATVHSDRAVKMRFHGVGFFPSERRPRVLWCGVDASANLADLATQIERVLEPLGIARETRNFVPHLTIARLESASGARELTRAAEEFAASDFGSARETKFYLFESILKRSGAEYCKIEAFPIVRDAA